MEDEDTGFFILVLGVLAAVLLVVSWWAIRDDDSEPVAAPTLEVEQVDDEVVEEPEPTPEPEPTQEPEPTPAPALPDTVVDVLGGDANLSSVAGLIGAAGLSEALAGDGPFTVLAPSNAAVEAFDADAAGRLFGDDNAADTLTYHVIPGVYTSEDLVGLVQRGARTTEVETLQGDPITLSLEGDQLIINGNAVVSAADAAADNGVVHTIENILVPREAALNLIVGIEPIQFASGSAVISTESEGTLDQVVEVLQSNEINVTVEGHTDSQGDVALNEALSLERARAVVNYLVANGVDESRLSAEGFGPSTPVADNETDEGRALNRRIEFSIER